MQFELGSTLRSVLNIGAGPTMNNDESQIANKGPEALHTLTSARPRSFLRCVSTGNRDGREE